MLSEIQTQPLKENAIVTSLSIFQFVFSFSIPTYRDWKFFVAIFQLVILHSPNKLTEIFFSYKFDTPWKNVDINGELMTYTRSRDI